MGSVRRSVWIAAVVCGVLLVSIVAFWGRQTADEESRPVGKEMEETSVAQGVQTGGGGEKERTRTVDESIHSVQEEASELRPRSAKPRVPRLPAKTSLQLSPDRPRLGETARLTFTITTLKDEPKLKVWFRPLRGVMIVGGSREVYCSMSRGETRTFSIDVKLLERYIHVGATAGRPSRTKTGEERVGYHTGRSLGLAVVDDETGQYGSWEELLQDPRWNYDPLSGEKCRVSPAVAERNRNWIEQMREPEPSITDWEALYLCRDAMLYSPQSPEDSLRMHQFRGWETILEKGKILLQKGWLEEFRRKPRTDIRTYTPNRPDLRRKLEEHLKWLRKLRKENTRGAAEKGTEKSEIVGPVPTAVDSPTQFTGSWVYQKYPYDTTGLDSIPIEVPVRKATVALWGHPVGQPTLRDTLGKCLTEDDGAFDITVYLDNVYAWVVYEVLYPTGPNSTNPGLSAIKTSDPNGPYFGWRLPEDTTIWHFTADSMFWSVTPGLPHDFGKAYVDTASGGHQPWSGSVNIYEALLNGYEYVVPHATPDTLGVLRALWEPGFVPSADTTSYCSLSGDTIFVLGLDYIDTDEWDDGTLIHEYGHHVMFRCAEYPPNQDTIRPYWWVSDSSFPNTAYTEGWPDFLQGVVRDSIYYVDTDFGIGGGGCFWFNIEDPWDIDGIPPDSFQGGPYYEGAVTGALWDVFDSADEDTYPVYAAPGWPDTGLCDTLTLGFDEIWNIFDDYPPLEFAPDTTRRCWTIFHFITGWRSPEYNYGHETGMRPIFLHHRIDWDQGPGSPTDLNAIFQPMFWAVHLTWSPPGTKQPIVGYCLYRKEIGDTLFERIAEPADSSYTDTTVATGRTYFYTVTAFDTLGIESDTSNVEWIWIPFASDTLLATAFNNANKIAVDSNGVHLVFVSQGKICYSSSGNQAMSWSSPDTLGEGETPSLALDINGNPHVVWMGLQELPEGRRLYYARYDTIWHTDTLLSFGGLVRPYLPSFDVDTSGYGHVVWEEHWRLPNGNWRLKYARFVTQNPDSIVTELVDVSSSSGWYGSPSIALDDSAKPHVVWRRHFGGEIYYSVRVDTGWTDPVSVSQSPSATSSWPCLDFSGGKLSAVRMEEVGTNKPNILYRPIVPSDTIEHVTATVNVSSSPVIVAGTYVVWAEDVSPFTDKWEVFGRRRRPNGTWEDTLMNLSRTTDRDSRFPQVAFSQDTATGYLYAAWTERDSTPYAVMAREVKVPTVPWFGKQLGAGTQAELLLLPRVFGLSQNYPNPFHQMTDIRFQIPVPSHVTLKVYDVTGRFVRTLVDENRKAGFYRVGWDGKNTTGQGVSSGIYFYRIEADDFTRTRKMVLLR